MLSYRPLEVACVTGRARVLALAAAVIVTLLFVLVDAKPAHAADFTVTNTADPGDGTCNAACTLREAINAANVASSDDTINFDIPDNPAIAGLEVKTISPSSHCRP
jgi:CSLREA domain-containing protein